MKKLLFTLVLCLLCGACSRGQSKMEDEAMTQIRKAYGLNREGKTEEALNAIKNFETLLAGQLSPENVSDAIAIYYAETLTELLGTYGEEQFVDQMPTINWQTVYNYATHLSEQDIPIGQSMLGLYFYNKEQYSEALPWFRKAAEQGFPAAQTSLGLMYSKGLGVEKDEEQAMTWLRKAAELGYASAQTNLGYLYLQRQNYEEAFKRFLKAAEQGDARALACLRDMSYLGLEVTKDTTEAVKWYRKAAEQGNLKALENIKRLMQNIR